ncbi:MAG: hypothetical protein IJ400_06070 [Clostridia bacterium]|nr:hypothetical protein [Clostridia bacterium]
MKKEQKAPLGARPMNDGKIHIDEKALLLAKIEDKEKESDERLADLVERLKGIEESHSANKSVLRETIISVINMIAQFKELIQEVRVVQIAFETLSTTLGIVEDVFKVIDLIIDGQIKEDPGAFSSFKMSIKVNRMGRSIRRRFSRMQQTINVLPKMLSFMSGFNKTLGSSMGKMNKKSKRDVDNFQESGSGLTPSALDMLKDAGIDYEPKKPLEPKEKKSDDGDDGNRDDPYGGI